MQGQLSEIQIDNLLLSQSIGHLGCINGKKPYVLPITYLYDDSCIYSQTCPGLKLDIMRSNPLVCFEVSRHTDMFNWESVIAWGYFEELGDGESIKARRHLFESVFQLMTPSTIHRHEHTPGNNLKDDHRLRPIMFRIKLTNRTGRFSKTP